MLVRGQASAALRGAAPIGFAMPLHDAGALPAALNSFGLWLALMVGAHASSITAIPIAQLMVLPNTIGAAGLCRGPRPMSERRCRVPQSLGQHQRRRDRRHRGPGRGRSA